MFKILVVEDDRELNRSVCFFLSHSGYEAFGALGAEEAYDMMYKTAFDLIISDVMMPGIDGFELCAKIRERYTYPIIMLTARVEDVDKITGLSIGADDYVTKPFNPLELLARVKAQLRRYKKYDAVAAPQTAVFESKGLTINKQEHTVLLFDEPINLTPTEFDILWLLCDNAGSVVSSECIFEAVWKEDYLDSNNTVMVHIRRIREKLKEPPRNPRFIKTVWGVGYKVEK